MKKLLALILCVMMFVSIIPTSAFAAYDTADQRVWRGDGQSADIIKALRQNIENMYASIAVDNAVVSSVKSFNTMINDLVDNLLKDYNPSAWGTGLDSATLGSTIKAGLKATVGGAISDYISKHSYQFVDYDSHGNAVFNPVKYASVFSAAATDALASKKAMKGIEAYMVYTLQRSVYEKVAQQAGLLLADMPGWWGAFGFDDASKANPSQWSTAAWAINNAYNLDGVLHNVNHTYEEYLSWLGQLGADLDADGVWDNDANGFIVTVDGKIVPTTDGHSETVNTARNIEIATGSIFGLDGNGNLVITQTADTQGTPVIYGDGLNNDAWEWTSENGFSPYGGLDVD